ncbi:MAG: glycoside hydrolase domain-containing protein [Dokdonella sp.]
MNRECKTHRPTGRNVPIGFGWCVIAALAALSGFWFDANAASDEATVALDVTSMHLLNSDEGWVAGRMHLLRTADDGQNWLDITPQSANFAGIDAVFFIDAREGWAAIAREDPTGIETPVLSSIAHTRDGGASWTIEQLTAAALADATPMALDFVDARHGWLIARAPSSSNFQRGRLLRTDDGGRSWRVLPAPPIVAQPVFVSPQMGWLAGGPQRDRLYVTRDGGTSWQRQTLPGVDANRRVVFQRPDFRSKHDGTLTLASVDASNAWTLMLYTTHDGGAQWRVERVLPLPGDASAERWLAEAVDAQNLVVAPAKLDAFSLLRNGTMPRTQNLRDTLPAGAAITTLDFNTVDHGWIRVNYGSCAAPKTDCRQQSHLFLANDGAQTMTDITPRIAVSMPGPQPDSVDISHNHKGFDQCAAGTIAQMQSWWTSTPWSDANIYIGGSNRGCAQSQLTRAWVKAIFAQGWHLIPTWVGPQAPGSGCSGCGKMSSTPATARQQGIAEADLAIAKVNTLGLQQATVIYYDMEGYSPSSAAVSAFIDGWTERLHELGNTSGVYGGPSNANADWAAIAHPPDAVWIASWDGHARVTPISGLSESNWANQQRIHQYQGGHDETWGGVTFNIDSNYEDGPVAGVDCIFCNGFE